ncbi:MAG: peptidase C25 [Vicingaceae bacterium]|nr:MAG: peptidase C25 [Vicingaceae bacterium]
MYINVINQKKLFLHQPLSIIIFFCFIFLLVYEINAQKLYSKKISPQYVTGWEIDAKSPQPFKGNNIGYKMTGNLSVPFLMHAFESPDKIIQSFQLSNETWENIPDSLTLFLQPWTKIIDTMPAFRLSYGRSNKNWISYIEIFPIRYQNKQWQILSSYDIIPQWKSSPKFSSSFQEKYASNSVLSGGQWYKFGVTQNGLYTIDYFKLKSWGIDIENINPQTIKIYTHLPGQLPYTNNNQVVDDLVEMPIFVYGESDQKFDPGDYILFAGYSPVRWVYNSFYQMFVAESHEFCDTTYYFLTFEGTPGKRIAAVDYSNLTTNANISGFYDFILEEKNLTNFLKSGKLWVGDLFDVQNEYNYTFAAPNIDPNKPVKALIEVYARSTYPSGSSFTIQYPGGSTNINVLKVSGGSYDNYANGANSLITFNTGSNPYVIKITYNKPQSSDRGWLDRICINQYRTLNMQGTEMFIHATENIGPGNANLYTITGLTSPPEVWDVTLPWDIKKLQGTYQNFSFTFKAPSDTIRKFIIFTQPTANKKIYFSGKIENQNLHAHSPVNYLIITPSKFVEDLTELEQFYNNKGISTRVVAIEKIYNEYSAGAVDIMAIRHYIRHIYKKGIQQNIPLQYVLLAGDGSYDNKNYRGSGLNLIPTYQSPQSVNPIGSYSSDDFYAVLDDNEGLFSENPPYDVVDIGVGRWPVKNSQEIKNIIKKIKTYNSTTTLGDWRNLLTFVADDEDGNIHMSDANSLTTLVQSKDKSFNIDKIYFDSFQQETTPGGQRYPEVNKKINENVNKGSLIFNYTGHGGEVGWAHERVLGLNDIFSWNNLQKLTLFFTATCEFSRWDDPSRTSAGEYCLLNENGGAIALLSTTRLVYSSPNKQLNQLFYDYVFAPVNGRKRTIGEVYYEIKKIRASDLNARNFSLVGDPAITLNFPKYFINVTEINGKPANQVDTIRALSKVTIKGVVQDTLPGGVYQTLTQFNGVLYPTIFDKEKTIQTLNNDGNGVFTYKQYINKIFKGKVSVKNGEFEFSFVVPKDIDYNFGPGRASFYGDNGIIDASGFFENFIIGGYDTTSQSDNQGPDINVFMNDEKFVSGGITDENPLLLVHLFDENGINMTGNGIGHDIIGILDNKTNEPIVLNDYYEADLDSYQSGKVKYPFKNLTEGEHTLKVRAWDVYNNVSEKEITFKVVKKRDIELQNVLNYPNPFTTHTTFWFQHNQAGQPLHILIQIYTVTGRVVKTIQKDIIADGYLVNSIEWDGRDDFGERLGRGVYLYKLTVLSGNGTQAEKIEKLVIL